MGIQGLNSLVKTCTPEKPQSYDKIIIDGSNLIFNKLTRQVSQLKKLYILNEWKSIDKDIIFQTKFIINNCANDILTFIYACKSKFNCDSIYIVIDPLESPSYHVSADLSYISEDNTDTILKNNKYITTILHEDEINSNSIVEFNIKHEEQESRKKKTSKQDLISNELAKLEQLKISDEENDSEAKLEQLKSIFEQSYLYLSNSDLIKLSYIVMLNVEMQSRNENIHIIDAIDEADLVIKNIAYENKDYKTLIISADTDYYVLFSDSENVHITNITLNENIYSPYKCWKNFLENAYSYDSVIRAAPLYGNDYTIHENVISATRNFNDMRDLFNINDRFNELKRNRRKTISSVTEKYKIENITHVLKIDEMIHDYNEEYFKKYYLSVIIYKNWFKYNRMNERHSCNNDNEYKNLIDDEINNILQKLSNTFTTLYQWNSENIFVNWNEFFSNVKPIDKETYIEYYNSIDVGNYGEEYM